MIYVIPYFIPHRGCPHQCLFCNQNVITGKNDPYLSLQEEIVETIEQWLATRKKAAETHFAFYGGSFTCLPEPIQNRMLEAVQPWLESGQIDVIRLSTRPDCIDNTVCTHLQGKGVGIVEIGVQSLDDIVLQASQRGHTADDCISAVRKLRCTSIEIGIQLMPGLPRETRKSFIETVQRVIQLQPDFVRLYPALVVKQSGLAELYKCGDYVPLTLDKAVILVSWARGKFLEAGIRVVRMGLQPTTSLEESLVAGPYHPSFGELVISRDWLKRVKAVLALNPGKRIQLTISHRDLSAFNGLQKKNQHRLETLGMKERIEVIVDRNIERGSLSYTVC